MQTLRLYCDVARHHSFSRAAAEHGITQSAASQRVSQLEKRLGVTLIDRSVRPLALTAAGEVFLRGCLELIEGYDQLELEVARLEPPLTGHIRVAAIYSAGIELLNRATEAFEKCHPSARVTITYAHPDEVYDAVRHDQADLGIVSYPERLREVGVIPLRDEAMALVVAPTHPLAGRGTLHPRELAGVSLVNFDDSLPAGRRIKRYLREHQAAVRISSTFDNIDTIKSAVAVTEHAAILPRRLVEREVKAGALAAVALSPGLSRPVGVIYHRRHGGRDMSPAVRAFLDGLLKWAAPDQSGAPADTSEGRNGDGHTRGDRDGQTIAQGPQDQPAPLVGGL